MKHKVIMPKQIKKSHSKMKFGAAVKSVTLLDVADRVFLLDNGTKVELVANVPLEVDKQVAKELVSKYPYLKVV